MNKMIILVSDKKPVDRQMSDKSIKIFFEHVNNGESNRNIENVRNAPNVHLFHFLVTFEFLFLVAHFVLGWTHKHPRHHRNALARAKSCRFLL